MLSMTASRPYDAAGFAEVSATGLQEAFWPLTGHQLAPTGHQLHHCLSISSTHAMTRSDGCPHLAAAANSARPAITGNKNPLLPRTLSLVLSLSADPYLDLSLSLSHTRTHSLSSSFARALYLSLFLSLFLTHCQTKFSHTHCMFGTSRYTTTTMYYW